MRAAPTEHQNDRTAATVEPVVTERTADVLPGPVESRTGGPDVISRPWSQGTDDLEERERLRDVEVERVVERVLGDAARRHGIEV